MKFLIAAATTALLILLVPPAPAAAPLVTGGGAAYFPDDSPAFAGDRVEITVVADASTGRFTAVHQSASGGLFARATGRVDCAVETGDGVVVTGVITGGFHGTGIDPVGHRVSFLFTPDSFALDLDFLSGHTIAPCTSDPILAMQVSRGGYRLH